MCPRGSTPLLTHLSPPALLMSHEPRMQVHTPQGTFASPHRQSLPSSSASAHLNNALAQSTHMPQPAQAALHTLRTHAASSHQAFLTDMLRWRHNNPPTVSFTVFCLCPIFAVLEIQSSGKEMLDRGPKKLGKGLRLQCLKVFECT